MIVLHVKEKSRNRVYRAEAVITALPAKRRVSKNCNTIEKARDGEIYRMFRLPLQGLERKILLTLTE
jgi:hypothetical protein